MPNSVNLPLLKTMIPGGLMYGANYLVEFEPQSLWYETSLTITAEAVRQGIRTDYHTFMHMPGEIRDALSQFGLDPSRLEEDSRFRIMDSYTATTFLEAPETRERNWETFEKSLNLKDWARGVVESNREPTERSKNRLHIDDNTSVLLQHNSEKSFIDFWRTHIIPDARTMNLAEVHSVVAGTYSDIFYKQYEALCNGIIEFRSIEERGQVEHYMRARTMRGQPHDSRWRHLRLLGNGGVKVELAESKEVGLGIHDWLKGPRK